MPNRDIVRSLRRPNSGVITMTTMPPIAVTIERSTSFVASPRNANVFGIAAPTTALVAMLMPNQAAMNIGRNSRP